ncbi:MAG: cyclopropane-fatty-acyl-phospholipid synthase family protein [Acidimicrobiia bacterium]|nr:cyclopropane-fatty-acyl-phospholipid synthase family protein [Acidimicrobiia bacterium]
MRLFTTIGNWISRLVWVWLQRRVRFGTVILELPDGKRLHQVGDQPGPTATITLVRPGAALRRIAMGGGVGFAEAYLAGDWDTTDLVSVLENAGRNLDSYVRVGRPNRLLEPVRRLWQRVTSRRRGAIESIDRHYNLGNEFYELWLDPSMTYSSAVFTEDDQPLSSAQEEKYRRLAELAGLTADDHVLEIGCGWGGFAEYAATTIGCRVTGLTLSSEQAEYARDRLKHAKVDDRTEIKLIDFREEDGRYDKVVSIEMIESISASLWPELFSTIARVLRPGGLVAMQAITIADELFESLLRRDDFISKHIFPGGALPTVAGLHALAANNSLQVASVDGFGSCYATTLRLWRRRFEAMWPTIARSGFDERFRRTWQYYLAYCEAGFTIGRIDVHQIGFRLLPE